MNSPYKRTSNVHPPLAMLPSAVVIHGACNGYNMQIGLHLHRTLQCIWTQRCHTADDCAVRLSPWSYCCWCNDVVFTPLCLWVFVVCLDPTEDTTSPASALALTLTILTPKMMETSRDMLVPSLAQTMPIFTSNPSFPG